MNLYFTTALLVFLVGCGSASHVVRLDPGQATPIIFTPLLGAHPVNLDDGALKAAAATWRRNPRLPSRPQQAARQLFEVQARSGFFTYDMRSHRITEFGAGGHLEGGATMVELELTRAYRSWCETAHRTEDCLHLLTESPTIDGDGRFVLALALAQGAVLDEMLEAFKDVANPQALMSAVLWTWTTYMLLLTVPEPVTKGIAAVMTATLICYVGVDTFWGLIMGFKQLMMEADESTTFGQLRKAGERYGKLMGRNAARAFVMLATAAIGNTAPGLAAQVPSLPGAMQAAAQARTQLGIHFAAIGEVQMVAVSAESTTIALSAGAVAMTAHGMGSQGGSKLLENQKPTSLAGELERAQQLGVRPVTVETREFLKYAKEGPIKWVVTPNGELKVVPHTWRGLEISHAVASGGEPVLAAGEADIAVQGRTAIGLEITPRSGHYLFGATEAGLAEALSIGRQAFARFGITFP